MKYYYIIINFPFAELLGEQAFDSGKPIVFPARQLPTRVGFQQSWSCDYQLSPESSKVRSSIPDVFKCLISTRCCTCRSI